MTSQYFRPRAAARISAFVIVALFGMWKAWDLRFVQDDAYISWRYADNLARGVGLVWNEGERVEGYTNFLWTIILAVPHALAVDVEIFATGLGLALFATTLAMFYLLLARLTRSWFAAAAGTLMLGLFPSFAAFATGGLETQLQACLVMATLALVINGIRRERPSALLSAGIGTMAALAVLTRMDSFVMVAPLVAIYGVAFLLTHGWRNLAAFGPAVVVPIAICGSWLAWKLAYYGSLLPNSYRAKVDGMEGLLRPGVRFILSFVQAYAFYLPLACLLVGAWLAWERRLDRRVFAVLFVPLMLWVVYVVSVGGDFMEYRFLIAALPLAFLATYWVMCELDAQSVRAALLTSMVIGGGMWTYSSPNVPKPIGSPLPLKELAVPHDQEWFEIGTVLGKAFAHSVQPKIAVVPSGVIPYRSRLPSVDMLGLNDAEVQDFIYLPGHLVGHRRLAPLDLLERRRVNFLIGHPVVRAQVAPGMRYSFADFAQRPFAYRDDHRLKRHQVIELPLSGDRVTYILYLTEDSAVTARLDQLGWRRYPLE